MSQSGNLRGASSEARPSKENIARAKALVSRSRKYLRKKNLVMLPEARGAVVAATEELASIAEPPDARSTTTSPELELAYGRLEGQLSKHFNYKPKSVIAEYAESIGVALLIALVIRGFLVEAFKIPTGSMIPTLEINDHIFVNKCSYGLRIPFVGTYAFTWSAPERGEVIVFEFPGKGPDHGKDYIKRVVAVPGDKVRLENHVLIVNGEPVGVTIEAEAADCNDQFAAVDGGLFSGCTKPKPLTRPGVTDRCKCVVQRETTPNHSYRTQHRAGGVFCRTSANWPTETPELLDAAGEYFGAQASNPMWPDVLIPEGHVMVMGDNRDNSRDGRFWGLVPFDNIKGRAFITWWATDFSRMFRLVE
jgi:signal peptidase I